MERSSLLIVQHQRIIFLQPLLIHIPSCSSGLGVISWKMYTILPSILHQRCQPFMPELSQQLPQMFGRPHLHQMSWQLCDQLPSSPQFKQLDDWQLHPKLLPSALFHRFLAMPEMSLWLQHLSPGWKLLHLRNWVYSWPQHQNLSWLNLRSQSIQLNKQWQLCLMCPWVPFLPFFSCELYGLPPSYRKCYCNIPHKFTVSARMSQWIFRAYSEQNLQKMWS